EQPDRADLLGSRAPSVGECARAGVDDLRATDLPAVRRGVQPHRVRRATVCEPDGALSVVGAGLHVRQDAADARSAHRLPGATADDATGRTRGAARRAHAGPGGDRLRVSERAPAARATRARNALD